jgi:hypothetical protein
VNAATLRYITEHRADGANAIALALADDLTTARNILTDDLSGYLTRTGIFEPFLAYKAGMLPPGLAQFKPAFANLDYILANLRGRVENGQLVGGFVRTTDASIAAQMDAMIRGFKQAGMLTADTAAGFISLGGGYKYDRLTASEIRDAWAEADARLAYEELQHGVGNAYNAVVEAMRQGERNRDVLAQLFTSSLGE